MNGSEIVDFKPVLDALLQLAAAVLMVLGSWGITRLMQKLQLDKDALIRGYLDAAMRNALAYALEHARAEGAKVSEIAVRNKVVADAANYVLGRTPDAVKHFGLTEDAVRAMLIARLPALPVSVNVEVK